MDAPRRLPNRRELALTVLLNVAVWVLVWVLSVVAILSYNSNRHLPTNWDRLCVLLVFEIQWGLLTVPCLWLCVLFPLRRAAWRANLAIQLAAWVAVPAAFVLLGRLEWPIAEYFCTSLGDGKSMGSGTFVNEWVHWALSYVDIFLASHVIHYVREGRSREVRSAQLETRLVEARLEVLRIQLHPHFLFNTLNTISALVRRDPAAAERMLAELGDLLRDSFEKVGAQVVSLRQELESLGKYLAIETTRFGDRLRVDRRIDPQTLDAEVPNLLLQPLAENAVRHGISRRKEGGSITIWSRRNADGTLEIGIRDDGPGFPLDPPASSRTGVGLANTRARLEQLYGGAQEFELRTPEGGGAEVVIHLPFRAVMQVAGESPSAMAFSSPVAEATTS